MVRLHLLMKPQGLSGTYFGVTSHNNFAAYGILSIHRPSCALMLASDESSSSASASTVPGGRPGVAYPQRVIDKRFTCISPGSTALAKSLICVVSSLIRPYCIPKARGRDSPLAPFKRL